MRLFQQPAKGITTAIARLEREIELLREYRARLVADVVTGKLDVRALSACLARADAARRLPEVPGDTGPAPGAEDLPDEVEPEPEEATDAT